MISATARATCAVSLVLVFSAMAFAVDGPRDEQAALKTILPKFEKVWNARDLDAFMNLFHPESRMKTRYDGDPAVREKMKTDFVGLLDEFGAVKSYEIRGYIERKGRFVVRVTYEKKDVVPGTFAVKKDDKGNWLILDFNIDGQSEPELKQ